MLKFFFGYPTLSHPEGCDHLWVWAQHIFLCLPGDHWIWLHWSVSVPFEELPNGCHAKQHNQPRHSVCVKYIGYAPTALPSQQNTFTVLKSCSYFHVSHNSPPVSLSAALFCSTFSFPVLFASVLHVWARVSAPCSRGQANSLLLYLFLNPITQSDWDCPSVNGMGILREIAVSNNKPTCREDKSIFKVLRLSRTTVQMCITFFWWYYYITVPPCYAWLSSFSTSGTHSDWLHCCHGDGTISIYKIMDRSVTGFASQCCLSAVGRGQTWPSWRYWSLIPAEGFDRGF